MPPSPSALEHVLRWAGADPTGGWSTGVLLAAMVFGAALAMLVALLCWRLLRALDRGSRRRRALEAGTAERRAEEWLRSRGYEVLARQPRRAWPVRVGGASEDVDLRADLLVARGRRIYVAEVKRGFEVARVRHGPTRRQLLEYLIAFDADGVLLVDALGGRIDEVRFPALPR